MSSAAAYPGLAARRGRIVIVSTLERFIVRKRIHDFLCAALVKATEGSHGDAAQNLTDWIGVKTPDDSVTVDISVA